MQSIINGVYFTLPTVVLYSLIFLIFPVKHFILELAMGQSLLYFLFLFMFGNF